LLDAGLMVTVKASCRFGKLITEVISSVLVPKLLSDAEIKSHLKELNGWKHEGKFITRTFEFNHFMDAIAFVNEVAEAAEREEHHPDMNIRYTTVKLSIQTHSEGGVTDWDIGLAKAIDDLDKAVRRESAA
jgi:4a-hydroxytetrahydrobiopterin dehydratase